MLPQQHNRRGSISMIKDIIVNLEQQVSRDPARDFAITVAETFDAHIAGRLSHMRRIFRAM
jgi:hypothetical protein